MAGSLAFAPGHAKMGGRTKGTPNKATIEIKELALKHVPEAITRIVHLMHKAENEQVQLSAAEIILERAFGKVTQGISLPPGSAPLLQITMNLPNAPKASEDLVHDRSYREGDDAKLIDGSSS